MKSEVMQLLLIVLVFFIGSHSANAQLRTNYQGKWSFDAPSAPDGYTYVIIEIKKDSVYISFTDSQYKFPSVWTRVRSDSIYFQTFVDGTDVLFSLKIEGETNIKGNAVWEDGETQMILKKKTK